MSNPYGGNYRFARLKAIRRSQNTCQFCGMAPAVEAHHWADRYPSGDEVTENDLTAMCTLCHDLFTSLRRFIRSGGTRWQFKSAFRKALHHCATNAKYEGHQPSSQTTSPRNSTGEHPKKPNWKKSTLNREETERRKTTNAIGSSNAKPDFTLTRAERLRSRMK